MAKRHGIRLPLGRRRQRSDNAVAESFFATLKAELIHRQGMAHPQRQPIFEYVAGWYNTRRPALQPRLPQPRRPRSQRHHQPATSQRGSVRPPHRPCPSAYPGPMIVKTPKTK
ncbi:integrase core domain-containing protein [Micromonospora eburnea]|uniref:integrase core domain-containing protein n=1 Tax=Micromonospora eburnea TaxID=227316 RepID=UPI000B81D2B9